MDRRRTRTVAAFVVWAALFAAPPTVDAGAWTQPKGGRLPEDLDAVGFQDALVFLMEGGFRFHPKVYATVRVVQLLARGSVEPLPNTGSPSGVTNDTTYFAFAFEIDYLVNDRALSVGVVAEGATFYKRQAGGPVFSLYLAKKWDGSRSDPK